MSLQPPSHKNKINYKTRFKGTLYVGVKVIFYSPWFNSYLVAHHICNCQSFSSPDYVILHNNQTTLNKHAVLSNYSAAARTPHILNVPSNERIHRNGFFKKNYTHVFSTFFLLLSCFKCLLDFT